MSVTSRPERGAAAVLITASLLLLFGLAAIAIDIGATKDERGFDQHAADSSALGAALEYGLTGGYQPAVTQALRLVDVNLGRSLTAAEWQACSDADALPQTAQSLGLTPATPCISFFANEFVRVKVPSQTVDASFGRILGADSLETFALAVARVDQFPGFSNPPPFVVPAGTSAGELLCLRTNPSSTPMPPLMVGNGPGVAASPGDPATDPDPCDDSAYDPASQFFGTLDPKTYFDPATGAVVCKSNQVEWAMAAGIDHTVSQWDPDFVVGSTSPTGPAVNEEGCNPTPVDAVNTMQLKSGLSASELRCGLLSARNGTCGSTVPGPGSATIEPRLKQSTVGQTYVGETIDDVPLWQFMVDPATHPSMPPSCVTMHDNFLPTPSGGWDYFDFKDQMRTCLADWGTTGSGQIFTEDITSTPRFAFLPYLAETNLATQPSACPSSAASTCVHFNEFVPVFLQTLYSDVSGNNTRGTCDPGGSGARWIRLDGGQGGNCGKSNDNLDRISAFVLDCTMLPDDVCTGAPGGPGGTPVPKVQLTD